MGKLKGSKFNYQVKTENGEIILYNSLSKNLWKYGSEISEYVQNYMKNGIDENEVKEVRKDILDDLKEKMYLVNEEDDEQSISDLVYMEEVMDSKLQLTLLPTNSCNFRCPYCYESHEDITMSKELQEAIVKYVRKNISKYTGVVISWFGGEPTEELGIMEYLSNSIMDICKKRYKEFNSVITSNAYNFDLETFEKLLSWKIDSFHITIDGIKEVHDSQRFKVDGSGSFDRIIDNLINIKNTFKNRKFSFLIRTNVSKQVYERLDEYLKFMSDRFGDDERFQFYFRPVNDWGGDSIKDFKGNLLEKNGNLNIIKKIRQLRIPLNYAIAIDIQQSVVCYAGKRNHYMIDSDGVIKKCTCDTVSEENIIGKMKETGDMDLDLYKVAKWIKTPNKGGCETCKINPLCHGRSCPKENAWGFNSTCKMSRYEIEEIIKTIDELEKDKIKVKMEVK